MIVKITINQEENTVILLWSLIYKLVFPFVGEDLKINPFDVWDFLACPVQLMYLLCDPTFLDP